MKKIGQDLCIELTDEVRITFTDEQKRIIEDLQKMFEQHGVVPTDFLLWSLCDFVGNERHHACAEFAHDIHDRILREGGNANG